MTTTQHHGGSSSRARLILPIAAAGLLIALGVVLFRTEPPSRTVSEVVRSIRDAALAGGAPGAPVEAGMIGPWLVAAQSVDPLTGKLINFRLQSGPMLVSAATAAIVVDAEENTFSIEMWGVSYLRTPDEPRRNGKPVEQTHASVHRREHYVLGPAPFGEEIIPDGATQLLPPSTQPYSPIAGVGTR